MSACASVALPPCSQTGVDEVREVYRRKMETLMRDVGDLARAVAIMQVGQGAGRAHITPKQRIRYQSEGVTPLLFPSLFLDIYGLRRVLLFSWRTYLSQCLSACWEGFSPATTAMAMSSPSRLA